jgi:uncharacterized protein YndB with AHSA1/START domain
MWTFQAAARADAQALVEPSSFEDSITITATPARVIAAFFDPRALAEWWGVRQAVTTPRTPGIYAVHWGPASVTDDVLGVLGGTFYGTVMDYRSDRELFLADAYHVPPEGDAIGPMALHVTCEASGSFAWVHVKQSGGGDSPRLRRYYRIIGEGWRNSLEELKRFLERS